MTNSKQIKCPRCGELTEYSLNNPYRPFCSDRCKLIDLGEWASGKYAIPVAEPHSVEGAELSNDQADDESAREAEVDDTEDALRQPDATEIQKRSDEENQ